MGLDIFESVLTGSLGALAFLCIAVWALVTGVVHPDKAYQAQTERVKLLEGENSRLNESIVSLTEMNTQLQIDVATLKMEVVHLRQQLDRVLEGGRHD
jgi:predicted nuclease with TOPRIM domain